jgi:hypothetical protein
VSCKRDSFARGIFSLLQRRKNALLGWSENETLPWREENSRSHDWGQWPLSCEREFSYLQVSVTWNGPMIAIAKVLLVFFKNISFLLRCAVQARRRDPHHLLQHSFENCIIKKAPLSCIYWPFFDLQMLCLGNPIPRCHGKPADFFIVVTPTYIGVDVGGRGSCRLCIF